MGAFTKVTTACPDIDAGRHVVVLQVEDADVSNPKIVLGVVWNENEAVGSRGRALFAALRGSLVRQLSSTVGWSCSRCPGPS